MKHLISLALLVAACGDDTRDDPSLDGSYLVVVNDSCALQFDVHGDSYILGQQCILDDESLGVEAEFGTLEVSNDTLTLTPTKTSCPMNEDGEPQTLMYKLSRDKLLLGWTSQLFTLERIDLNEDANSVVYFGCFTDDSFTGHPIVSI